MNRIISLIQKSPDTEEERYQANMSKLIESESIRRANEYLDNREKIQPEYYAALIVFNKSKIFNLEGPKFK